MKAKEEMLQKIRSVLLCMSAHPDNEPDSEFEDRIDDLIEIESFLKNIPNQYDWIKIESEDDLPKHTTLCHIIRYNRKQDIANLYKNIRL